MSIYVFLLALFFYIHTLSISYFFTILYMTLESLKSLGLSLIGTPYNVRDEYPQAEWYRILRTWIAWIITHVTLQHRDRNEFIELK